MKSKLDGYLKEFKLIDAAVIAQLLDPAIKNTLMFKEEKSAAKEKLNAAYSKYSAKKTGVVELVGSSKRESIRESVIAGLRKQTTSTASEVDEYLNTGTVSDVSVLSYWERASDRYPGLRELARDVFGFPASAVQSERENSKARYLITDNRNRLSCKTVQANMCLKSWNLILSDDVVALDK